MVPTDTMFGRLTGPGGDGADVGPGELSERDAVATASLLPYSPRDAPATPRRACRCGGAHTGSIGAMTASPASPAASSTPGGHASSTGDGVVHRISVLLYSDDVATRDAVRLAVGRRPARDLRGRSWRECATAPAVVEAVDERAFDLLVLDGEAAPDGGLGLCRQLKNEIFDCPPVLVLTGRPQDAWLATWSQADLAVPHPLDPVAAGRRGRRPRPDRGLVRGCGSPCPLTCRRAACRGRPCSPRCSPGRTSTAEARAGRWTRSCPARRARRRSPASWWRCAPRARRSRSCAAWPTRCWPTPSGSRCPGRAVDIVGTGGDRAHTVNISTMAALVVAGAGDRVVKHGNRAASSACGSADVLEALGVDLRLSPERVAAVAEEAGITFCFAQVFHPSFRHAASARRDLGDPHGVQLPRPADQPGPADVRRRRRRRPADGAADGRRVRRAGQAALVFRGDDGLDELTISTTSSVW